MATKFNGKILKDGKIKTTTGAVDPENHQNAEAFFAMIAKLTGGESTREVRGDHQHAHVHHDHHHHHGA